MAWVIQWLFTLLITQVIFSYSSAAKHDEPIYKDEMQLYNEIFLQSNYSKLFRPTKRTEVSLMLALTAVLEVNEKEGYITTTHMPKISWVDKRLSWSKSQKKLNHMQIPCSKIWTPDIEVLNRYTDTVHDNSMETLCWLHSDGQVFFVPRRTFQTPCTFVMDKFPFDQHVCQIMLGSWAYMMEEVDVRPWDNGTEKTFYSGHSDWTIGSFTMNRNEVAYDGHSNKFSELVVDISMVRKPKYFYYMFVLPANVMLFLLPVIHFIPPGKECKIILLSCAFISVILMFNSLEEFMPAYAAESPPRVLKIYSAILIFGLVSAIITTFCMALANGATKTKRVPLIFRKLLVSKVVTICCVCTDSHNLEYQLLHLERLVLQREETEGDRELNENHNSTSQQNTSSSSNTNAIDALQLLVGEMQRARYKDQMRMEWQQLSQLIDRFYGIVMFFVAFIVSALNHAS